MQSSRFRALGSAVPTDRIWYQGPKTSLSTEECASPWGYRILYASELRALLSIPGADVLRCQRMNLEAVFFLVRSEGYEGWSYPSTLILQGSVPVSICVADSYLNEPDLWRGEELRSLLIAPNFYTLPRCRGRGLASLLFGALHTKIRERLKGREGSFHYAWTSFVPKHRLPVGALRGLVPIRKVILA